MYIAKGFEKMSGMAVATVVPRLLDVVLTLTGKNMVLGTKMMETIEEDKSLLDMGVVYQYLARVGGIDRNHRINEDSEENVTEIFTRTVSDKGAVRTNVSGTKKSLTAVR